MNIAEKLTTVAKNQERVFNAGKKLQYDEFWDSFQNNGNMASYSSVLSGNYWTDVTFKPKYPIKCTTYSSSANSLLQDTLVSRVEVDIILKGIILSNFFYNATKMVYVKKIITDATVTGTYNFKNCSLLEDITFEGVVAGNLAFHNCYKLLKKSIENFFEVMSPDITGLTLTLSKTAVINAFGSTESTEWKNLVDSRKNWTISLIERE